MFSASAGFILLRKLQKQGRIQGRQWSGESQSEGSVA